MTNITSVEVIDAKGCEKRVSLSEFTCTLLSKLTPTNNLRLGDAVVTQDCQSKILTAETIRSAFQTCETESASITNGLCVNVNQNWVKGLISTQSTPTLNLHYNDGVISGDINVANVVNGGICSFINSLQLGTFAFNGTNLLGNDCRTYRIPAQTISLDGRDLSISYGNRVTIPVQTLSYNWDAGQLSISEGNTIQLPIVNNSDLHITGLDITGNTITITRSDGVTFSDQFTIPPNSPSISSYKLVGNQYEIKLSDGSVLTAPIPPDCCPTGLLFSSGTLSLQTSDGNTLSVNIPTGNSTDCCPTGLSFSNGILSLSVNDGNTYTVAIPTGGGGGSSCCPTSVGFNNGILSIGLSSGGSLTTPINIPNCCPTGLTIQSGNILRLQLSNGSNLDVTLPSQVDVKVAGFSYDSVNKRYIITNSDSSQYFAPAPSDCCVSGISYNQSNGVLTLTQDNGNTYTATIPQGSNSGVTFNDTSTVSFLPSGTATNTVSASVKIDPSSTNSLYSTLNGLFVPNLCLQISSMPSASTTIQNNDEVVVWRNGSCVRTKYSASSSSGISFGNTSSINFNTASAPTIYADVNISTQAGNATSIVAGGLYTPDLCTQFSSISGATSYAQTDDEMFVISAGVCKKVKFPSVVGGGSVSLAGSQPISTSAPGGANTLQIIGGQLYNPSCVPLAAGKGRMEVVTAEGCRRKSPPPARVYQTLPQTLTAQPPVGNPPNAINYNAVDYDTDSLFVNTANGTEFVAPIDGIYHLDATALFDKVAFPVSVPNPSVAIHVYKYSGSSWTQYVMLGQDNATGNVNSGVTQQEYYSCVGGHDVKLLAGERLRIVPFMNFSNSITTTSISGYTFSSWSVHYVGDWQ